MLDSPNGNESFHSGTGARKWRALAPRASERTQELPGCVHFDIHKRHYTYSLKSIAGTRNGIENARRWLMESVVPRMSGEAAVIREAVSMNILIIDDEPSIRETCADVARQAGMKAFAVASAEEALEVLENSAVVIVLTQYGTIDSAVAATRLGAVDYVTKPFRIEELRSRLERAARAVELQQENQLLREQLRTRPGFGGLIGVSERMQRVYKVIQKVSQHEYPVLILGESGTGKELVAKSIHFSGPRKDRHFAPVDCSSLVPTLIESELFGYVKGAFTGALHGKQGLLEAANGG